MSGTYRGLLSGVRTKTNNSLSISSAQHMQTASLLVHMFVTHYPQYAFGIHVKDRFVPFGSSTIARWDGGDKPLFPV